MLRTPAHPSGQRQVALRTPARTGDTPKGSAAAASPKRLPSGRQQAPAAGHDPGTAPRFPVRAGLLRPLNGGHSPTRPLLRLTPPSPEAPPWRRTPMSSRSSAGRGETHMAPRTERGRGAEAGEGRAAGAGLGGRWGRPAGGADPPGWSRSRLLRHLRQGPDGKGGGSVVGTRLAAVIAANS